MNTPSTNLFPVPTFWHGVASVFDPSGSMFAFNTSESADEADAQMLAADWEAVAIDLRAAFEQFQEQDAVDSDVESKTKSIQE